MATLRQRKLAENIIENLSREKPLNKQELVVSSGYGEITADRHSKTIMEQKGVQEALGDYGFNVENAKKVVAAILETGENDNVKLKAADMIMKVHGAYAPEKVVNVNYDGNANEEALKKAEEAYLQTLDGTTGPTESA